MKLWGCGFTDEAINELERLPVRERAAIMNAVEKLEALGPNLRFPHVSAVLGFPGLYELRPQAGRSRHRPLFAKFANVYVILAIAPEARADRRGFLNVVNQAVKIKARFNDIEASNND
jgi:phage-related protein